MIVSNTGVESTPLDVSGIMARVDAGERLTDLEQMTLLVKALRDVRDAKQKSDEALSEMRAFADRLGEKFRTAQYDHQADIAKIGEKLLEAAEKHDWCEEFDETLTELNEELHYELPTRKRTYSVEVPFNATYVGTYTVEIEADNPAEATRLAVREIDGDTLDRHISQQVFLDSYNLDEDEITWETN